MANSKSLFLKGTKNLFYIHCLALAATMIESLPFIGSWFSWVSTLINIVMVFILFQLAPVKDRYRKAAIFMAVTVGGGLLTKLIDIEILSLVCSICSLIAIYQEYKGHSEMMKEAGDYKLADKWHGLFYWQVFGGFLLGILSTPIIIVLGTIAVVDTNLLAAALVALVIGFDVVMSIVYLLYIKRMRAVYEHYDSGVENILFEEI